MRKLFALAMVAMLALTIALAAVGCSKQESTTTTETTPPAEQTTMPADTGAAADTMSHMGMDSTMHQ